MSDILEEIEEHIRSGASRGFTVWVTSGQACKDGAFMVSVASDNKHAFSIEVSDSIEEALRTILDRRKPLKKQSLRSADDII